MLSDTTDIKRVLVTGATRGIGLAVARTLARSGHRIVVNGRTAESCARALEALLAEGFEAEALPFDVSDREAARAAVEADAAAHGAYWGVVLNAGINRDAPLVSLSDADWDDVLGVDLGSFYNVLKPALMPMCRKRRGRIVVMSSVSGIMGTRGQTNYSAAKAGLIGASKALAMELASRGITVNVVAPGLVETEMATAENMERIVPLIPMRRAGRPEEVASVVDFLMSDAAAYVTRAVIPVSGGLL